MTRTGRTLITGFRGGAEGRWRRPSLRTTCHPAARRGPRSRMKSFVALAIAACMAVTGAPAATQDFRSDHELNTGSRFSREPENAGQRRARQAQKTVARCVLNRNEDEIRGLLANSNFYSINVDRIDQDPDTIMDDLDISGCIAGVMRRGEDRMYMRFPYTTLRNLLAEEADLAASLIRQIVADGLWSRSYYAAGAAE